MLGQEVGHRWLAFLEFRDRNGQRSQALLGRGLAHWSFFFDSDASVMEGNDIEDLGGGSFRTTAAVQRYSRLDQYAMGLLPESQVPSFFYVESPTNVVPPRSAEDAPRVGVTFNGTRRDVLIQDIVAIQGPRIPSAADSPKVHRQAFIYLVTRRAIAGRRADRQGRSDPAAVGAVLPAGDRGADARGHAAAVGPKATYPPVRTGFGRGSGVATYPRRARTASPFHDVLI